MLKPTERERKRYVVFETLKTYSGHELDEAITRAYVQLWGEMGLAEAGVQFLLEAWNGTTGIIRTGHTTVPNVKAALSLLKTKNETPVVTKTKGVSGTLKKAKTLR